MRKKLIRGEVIKIISKEYPEGSYGQEFPIECVFEPCEEYDDYYGVFIGDHLYCIYWGDFELTGKFAEVEPMSDTRIKVSVSQDGIGKITHIIVDDKEQE